MHHEIDKIEAQEIETLIERMVAADMGDGDAAQRASLETYLAGDPGRQELHASVSELWERLGDVEPPALSEPVPSPRGFWQRAPRLAIAASMVPLLALAGLLAFVAGVFDEGRYRTELYANAAERRIVNLPDGSSVSLSADSVVAVDLKPERRNFVLKQGEALFDVAHDPDRPFIVAAGEGQIRAVGTAFNVRLAQSGVVVTVVEGTVKIEAGRHAAPQGSAGLVQIASAGQQVRYGAHVKASVGSAFITPPAKVDPARYASWANGVLRFEGETLAQVIAEVNRHSATDLRLTDADLGDTPIYGVLHIGDVEGLKSIVADIKSLDKAAVAEKLEVISGEGAN